ncbi:MAG: VOC family protein [Alphaproteobacteria bacterium]|nr:VOC family protein [Alphaproteobacteria bacterium]
MRLTRLGHVLLAVRDMARARSFYVDVLGFTVLEDDPDHGGVFLTLGKGSHILDLVPVEGETPVQPESLADIVPRPGIGHVAFQVDSAEDLRAAFRELTSAGVRVLAAVDHESQESIYFCDPEANMLEIYWERPNAREIFRTGRKDQDRLITL